MVSNTIVTDQKRNWFDLPSILRRAGRKNFCSKRKNLEGEVGGSLCQNPYFYENCDGTMRGLGVLKR
jgi:hypothetical protein